ncbi:Cytidine deaminase [Lamellibrachia satsuma]|nr:Cytidine deaminase [Lamellibrachia satsuma]
MGSTTPAEITHSENATPDTIRQLVEQSVDAKKYAYCPYSHFPVGAALLCEDGSIYTGCNVENAVYPNGLCAEKTAGAKAVSEGHRKFKAIAISSNLDSIITPCGPCRQFLAEFGPQMDVYMTKSDLTFTKMSLRDLLPLAFTPSHLEETQKIDTALLS